MRYMPDTAYQTFIFLYSSGLGFALGILYDFFRIFFYLLTGSDKKYLMARDIIYLLACLVINFLFLLAMSDGQILLYIIIGEIIGWSVWYFTLSEAVFKPVRTAANFVRKKTRVIISLISKIKAKVCLIFQKYTNFYRKNEKNLQKDLHNRHGIVYNSFVKLYCRLVFSLKRGNGNGREKET